MDTTARTIKLWAWIWLAGVLVRERNATHSAIEAIERIDTDGPIDAGLFLHLLALDAGPALEVIERWRPALAGDFTALLDGPGGEG